MAPNSTPLSPIISGPHRARVALSRHPRLVARGFDFFQRWGVLAVFIGRFFGPLRAVVPLVAGILGMRILPFQLANVSSCRRLGNEHPGTRLFRPALVDRRLAGVRSASI
jgi:hypothetical protein